jgi:hypothetical protein
MIADGPMDMAIIVSDPPKNARKRLAIKYLSTTIYGHILKLAVQTHAIKQLDSSHFAIGAAACSDARAHDLLRMPIAQPLHPGLLYASCKQSKVFMLR